MRLHLMLCRAFFALTLACFVGAFGGGVFDIGPASAQDAQVGPTDQDYQDWNKFADRAERVIRNGRATDNALEVVREDLANWRETFLKGQDVNKDRIETVQAQITALGPAPAEGATPESAEITQRRKEINKTLADLQAPAARASEAYVRANGLINEIDVELRTRTSDKLFSVGPFPLNPANWPGAFESVQRSVKRFADDYKSRGAQSRTLSYHLARLPLILPLLLVGIFLLIRSRHWVKFIVDKTRGRMRRGTGVFRIIASLLMVLLPYLGVQALCEAAQLSDLLSTRTQSFVELFPGLALLLLGIRWLADLAFHSDDELAVLPLDKQFRRQGRFHATILAIIFVLRELLDWLASTDSYSAATFSVLQFPLIFLAGVQLFYLGGVRNALILDASDDDVDVEDGEDTPKAFRLRLVRVGAFAASIAGIFGPVVATAGYDELGALLVFSTIASLALVTAVYIAQLTIHKIYQLFMGSDSKDPQGLIPVLLGIVLSLASIPGFALIWGAREGDLTEIWARFLEGFQLGQTRISPTDFLTVVLVFLVGYLLTRLVQGTLRNSVLPRTKLDTGGRNAILSGTGYLGICLAVMTAVSAGGLDLSSLALVAGALSVGIGFGLQNIIQNFVSGLILLIERPISEGDWIEVGGTHGIVKRISVRSTQILTFDRTDVIVPNGDFISGTVTNYTRGNVLGRIIVPVGVAYGTDTRKVERILLSIAREHPVVLMNPAPYVVFSGFGADSMDFEIRAILVDVNKILSVKSEMNHQIAERFAAENIEIPFAQRDIWLRNPEALHPAAPSPVAVVPEAIPEGAPHNPIPDHLDADLDVSKDSDGDLGDGEGR